MTIAKIICLTVLGIFIIAVIGGLELFALHKGHDGMILMAVITVISALAGTIGGYIVGRKTGPAAAVADTIKKTIRGATMGLFLIATLSVGAAGCDKFQLDPACAIQAASKCAAELMRCCQTDPTTGDCKKGP